MNTIESQLAEYFELQDELHPEIAPEEVVGPPVVVGSPGRAIKPVRSSTGIWWAGAAAVLVLVIGGAALFASQRPSDDPASEPVTTTVVVDASDPSAIADSFAQARSEGDIGAVVALLSDGAVVDVGPASSVGEIPAEMRWQEAHGLAFTFDRCEPAIADPEYGDASFSCYVTWTGSIAAFLGHGPDTFEYAIDVEGDEVVSVALTDLGNYGSTTWQPFRDWMDQVYPSEIDLMYTSDGHAVLTDGSIELWSQRTAEFVQIHPFAEQGSLDVTWVEHTGRDGTQPYGIDSYDQGEYRTVTEDGLYRSTDAVTWTFEAAPPTSLVPDEISDDGQWGMSKDFFTGTLLHNVDGEWQIATRPPEADQTGEWTWMRHLASSGDVVLVIGGPPSGTSEPRYVAVEEASYWRIDSTGVWQEVALDWDDSFVITAVPGGGFAYVKDGTLHTSSDGLTWTDRGTASVEWWDEGVFPGLLHATASGVTGSQVWTSPDAVIWTYQFTAPADSNLHATNLGIVASLWGDEEPENPEDPMVVYVEWWLLNDDLQTWTTLGRFTLPSCTECASWPGAIGDVMFVSTSTQGSSAVTYLAQLPSR